MDLQNKTQVANFITRIESLISLSIKNYERANDGARPEKIRDLADHNYQKQTDKVAAECLALGINIYWPGLYPAYVVNNHEHHNLTAAIKELGNK